MFCGKSLPALIVRWFRVANVILAILFLAGCAPIQSDVYFIETTPTPTPTLFPTPSPVLETVNFQGHGQHETTKFDLNPGLAIFEINHDGDGHFAIVLLDDKGEYVQVLIETTGAFIGSTAAQIAESGTYSLDITADGNWKVGIEQKILS